MNKIWFYTIMVAVLLGCEEATDWPIDAKTNDLIVVEALITNELKQHTVRLSRTIAEINNEPEAVSGATVAVLVDDVPYLFVEFPQGSGVYYSDSVQAVINRAYRLYISYAGKEYFADAAMIPVAPLQPLSYRLVDQEHGLYAIDFQDSNEPSMKEYWISWGHLPEFKDQPIEETLARTFHYTLSSIDVNQSFKPEQEPVIFPAGSVVLRRKYSLSGEHEAFVRSFLIETEWRGSVFDVQQGNVRTNLSEGAIGFFAVSTAIGDTTFIVP